MLGPLEAWHDGAPVQLGDQQQRFVLVVLLLHANKPVTPARLTEIVWAGRETRPTLVRSYIKRLRDSSGTRPSRPPRPATCCGSARTSWTPRGSPGFAPKPRTPR